MKYLTQTMGSNSLYLTIETFYGTTSRLPTSPQPLSLRLRVAASAEPGRVEGLNPGIIAFYTPSPLGEGAGG
jgi:hypothetical protein